MLTDILVHELQLTKHVAQIFLKKKASKFLCASQITYHYLGHFSNFLKQETCPSGITIPFCWWISGNTGKIHLASLSLSACIPTLGCN